MTEYSLTQDLQHFTGDHPPVIKLLTTIPFTFSLVRPWAQFYSIQAEHDNPRALYNVSGAKVKRSSAPSYWITLWFCQCGVLGGGMWNCTTTPFLKKHDTWGFASQCGAGPGLHQDLRMRHSLRAHSWDTLYVPQVLGIRARFKSFCNLEQSWVCFFIC